MYNNLTKHCKIVQSYIYILIFFRILVLSKGRIKEFGTPNELLADKNSLFYKMIKDAGIWFKTYFIVCTFIGQLQMIVKICYYTFDAVNLKAACHLICQKYENVRN